MEVEWKANPEMFEAGVPIFCPQHQNLVDAAKTGKVNRTIFDGSYFIPNDIQPGTYKTVETAKECYWERTTPGGEIIDNNFVTAAKQVTVTIRATDGSFTTKGCGGWRRA
ncbi:hypothetical protein [Actinokineospora enzanensis]|uniref:hypothetical protein n=1 Tax=Actinokineospora enzanensis TaxID=155975 RepID=UPI0012EC0D83|nr:hypothetical protein [Actinokineospora enzanensis]